MTVRSYPLVSTRFHHTNSTTSYHACIWSTPSAKKIMFLLFARLSVLLCPLYKLHVFSTGEYSAFLLPSYFFGSSLRLGVTG